MESAHMTIRKSALQMTSPICMRHSGRLLCLLTDVGQLAFMDAVACKSV